MSRLRLAVFDMDGTLVDSQAEIVSAMQVAFTQHEVGVVDPAAVRAVVGLSLDRAVSRLLPFQHPFKRAAVVDSYKQAFRANREAGLYRSPLFPGALQTLRDLDAEGVLLAIATGKSRRGLMAVLEEHGLIDHFTTLHCADDGPGKPDPHMLLEAMRATGAEPADTAMIGDTVFDIQMARAAKVPALGVSWGYHPDDQLRAAGAARILHHFHEVPNACRVLWGAERLPADDRSLV